MTDDRLWSLPDGQGIQDSVLWRLRKGRATVEAFARVGRDVFEFHLHLNGTPWWFRALRDADELRAFADEQRLDHASAGWEAVAAETAPPAARDLLDQIKSADAGGGSVPAAAWEPDEAHAEGPRVHPFRPIVTLTMHRRRGVEVKITLGIAPPGRTSPTDGRSRRKTRKPTPDRPEDIGPASDD